MEFRKLLKPGSKSSTPRSGGNMNIEYELKQAFKRAGFGDVNVTYKKMSVRSGYQIKTEMDLLIRIEQVTNKNIKLLEDLRGMKTIPPKSYDVIRNDNNKRE